MLSRRVSRVMKVLRKERGIPQRDAADYLGMSQANYSRLENGKIPLLIDHLEDFGELVDVPPHELVRQGEEKVLEIAREEDRKKKLNQDEE